MRAGLIRSRGLLVLGLGAAVAVASACGAFGAGDDGAPSPAPTSEDGGGADVSPPDDGAAPGDTGLPVDAAAEAAAVCLKTETFDDEADALIASTDNMFGSLPTCNIHIGAGIVRWNLSANAAAALRAGTATALSMTLTRAATSSDCGGSCLNASFTTTGGGLNAAPLRSDWVEATVSWFYTNKTATTWASAGAGTVGQDRGDVAGTAPVDAVMPSVTIPLDPAKVTQIWVAGTKVSFVLQAVNSGNFVFVTREASNPVNNTMPTTLPKLSVTYPCPDGG